VKRERDKDAKTIWAMRIVGDSYNKIADAMGRSKADIYRVCMTPGCEAGQTTSPLVSASCFRNILDNC